jgi:hypothetical protein
VTGSGGPTPGWYADPDGTPGLVRWWNGESWSDVTSPAGPGVRVLTSPALAPPRPPELFASHVDDEPAPTRRRPSWLVPLVTLVAIGAVLIGLLVSHSNDAPSAATATPPDPSLNLPTPAGPSFPPGTARIIDTAAGVSYPYLGEGWKEWPYGPQIVMSETSGEFFTTQAHTPDQGSFIAQCTSGPLAEGYGWTGRPSLKSTVTAVADLVRGTYYPVPNDRKVTRDQDLTVDGHAAHLFEFQLSWHVAGYESTGERAALLLIDVGKPMPALLYVSIPNTHAELYDLIDRLIAAVDVL